MANKNYDKVVKNAIENQTPVAQNQFDVADTIFTKAKVITHEGDEEKKSLVERAIFSMPPDDLALIDMLRSRAAIAGRISTTKSEIVRAGLRTLAATEVPELLKILNTLQKVRKGT